VTNFWPNGQKQVFRFSGDITYNDGFGGKAVDHDWSHAVLGVSTELGMGNLTITPSLNYQISMDDSVNRENEVWCGLNLTYRF
jgi:choline-glycine betaine transporter